MHLKVCRKISPKNFENLLINLEKSNSDEKFNKLLEAYNKLREEHIVVLRRVRFDFPIYSHILCPFRKEKLKNN
jgi:hypothetical protein